MTSASKPLTPSGRGCSRSWAGDGAIDGRLQWRAARCGSGFDWWQPVLFMSLLSGELWAAAPLKQPGLPSTHGPARPLSRRDRLAILEELRCSAKLSLGAAAVHLGIKHGDTVRAWELGRVTPRAHHATGFGPICGTRWGSAAALFLPRGLGGVARRMGLPTVDAAGTGRARAPGADLPERPLPEAYDKNQLRSLFDQFCPSEREVDAVAEPLWEVRWQVRSMPGKAEKLEAIVTHWAARPYLLAFLLDQVAAADPGLYSERESFLKRRGREAPLITPAKVARRAGHRRSDSRLEADPQRLPGAVRRP